MAAAVLNPRVFNFLLQMKIMKSLYRKCYETLFIPEFPNSKSSVPADVRKVYPAFRTQWNVFRELIRTSERDMEKNDQFKLNRFKSISRRFNLYRTNGKSKNYEI